MQSARTAEALRLTHFGRRLEERFNVIFTHGVRMEFFNLIKNKKLHLVSKTDKHLDDHGNSVHELTFMGVWRGHRIRLAMSDLGDFITIMSPDDSLRAFAEQQRKR